MKIMQVIYLEEVPHGHFIGVSSSGNYLHS